MFKDLPEGQTHSYNDGCGMPEHNNQSIDRQQIMEELVKGLTKIEKQAPDWATEHQRIGYNQAVDRAIELVKSALSK